MKLLTRTTLYYIISSTIIFIAGGFTIYYIVNFLINGQIDSGLFTEKQLIEQEIGISDSMPDYSTIFGHDIELNIRANPLPKIEILKDTMIYDSIEDVDIPHRQLFVQGTLYSKGYQISLLKSISSNQQLIFDIFIAMLIMFVTLIILMISINYIISVKLWIPFYNTLKLIIKYDINAPPTFHLKESKIWEFNQLNKVIDKMTKRINKQYNNLKEFTENISHETQTPLAIIVSKLELFIQNEEVSENQMKLLQSMYEATKRLSKLNKGFLLLSKIENFQFTDNEYVDIYSIIEKYLELFDEMLKEKQIKVVKEIQAHPLLQINKDLAHILFSNLISNAIKYNMNEGQLHLKLTNSVFIIANDSALKEIQPDRLFTRHKVSSNSIDSIGLGLAIVKRIVDNYHLFIDYNYENQQHKFKIKFPSKIESNINETINKS